jgi:hypothetical protein
MQRLLFVALAFCTIGSANCFAAVIKLEFCGIFENTQVGSGVLDGSFLIFDQSFISSQGLNYGLIDANIVTRRTDLAPFPSDFTYTMANFNSIVMPTTSVTSVVGPGTRTFPENVKGWSFLLPGQGELFAVFPENWLTTVMVGDTLSNNYITEFRSDGFRPDADGIRAVPEPSGLAIFGLSSAFIFLKRRFKKRTSSVAFSS